MNYIGFDLGDGESSIALLRGLDKIPQTILIDGEESFPTVVATLKSTNAHIIGNNAIANENVSYDFQACFKGDFIQNKNSVFLHYQRFLATLIAILRDKIDSNIFNTSEYQFVIGYPAGWNLSAVKDYDGLIKSCYIPQPLLISESRAALVYYAAMYTLSGVAQKKFLKSVLVCDFGSSTLDFAYLPDGNTEKIVSLGDKRLGGGLIDMSIVQHSIEQYNTNPSELMSFVKTDRSLLSLLAYEARELKEKYFLEEDDSSEFSKDVPVYRNGIEIVNITVNKKIIDMSLDTPLADCGNRSFRYALQSAINEVKNRLEGRKIDFMILTGGASRMKFFQDMCGDEFAVRYFLSKSPETDVAKGLALDGEYKYRLNLLSNDVVRFAQSNAIDSIISDKLADFYTSFSTKMLEDMTCDKIPDNQRLDIALTEWVENGRTRKDLDDRFSTVLKNYSQSSRFVNLINDETVQWLYKEILPSVQYELDELCRKYKLSATKIVIRKYFASPEFNPDQLNLAKVNITYGVITFILNLMGLGSQFPIPRFVRKIKSSSVLSEHNKIKMVSEIVRNLSHDNKFGESLKKNLSDCLKECIHTMSVELRV